MISLALAVLTACATSNRPAPDLVVRDEDSAIRIAKADCGCTPDRSDRWTAELKDRQWHVTLRVPGTDCPMFQDWVDARSGKAHDSTLCVRNE